MFGAPTGVTDTPSTETSARYQFLIQDAEDVPTPGMTEEFEEDLRALGYL